MAKNSHFFAIFAVFGTVAKCLRKQVLLVACNSFERLAPATD
jgi:hypothetical protein